jgi:hypothetical protein
VNRKNHPSASKCSKSIKHNDQADLSIKFANQNNLKQHTPGSVTRGAYNVYNLSFTPERGQISAQ